VEKLVSGGAVLARLDGRVVLAPFVLPGERIRVEAVKEKPGLVHARVVEVIEPAPERIAARCPYFSRCGGCQYQHAPYELQLNAKRAILAEDLQRIGKLAPPAEIKVVASEPWAYRNRTQLHIAGERIGYWEARSHKLCGVEVCPISSPKIEQTIGTLNSMLRDRRWPRFIRSVEIFTDERQVQLNVIETDQPVARRFFEWCAETIPGLVSGALDYDDRFRVSRNSFFQVNRFLVDRLVDTALEGVEGESALDVYAGVGLFTLALARKFAEVTAVESGAAAVRDLEFNAGRVQLTNVRAVHRSAEEFLTAIEQTPDYVLLDPPRAGLGKAVVQRLVELRPRQLTVVACDPATLARDLAGLVAAGYRIEKMTLVDLFQQTMHLETVVQLRAE